MNNPIIFKKGQRVTVSNSCKEWGTTIYEIGNTVALCSSNSHPNRYGMYTLMLNGSNVGAAYNDEIKPAKQPHLRIKAASHILCGDNLEEQLNLLDQATDTIPEGVNVCEAHGLDPIENIKAEIESLVFLLTNVVDEVKRALR